MGRFIRDSHGGCTLWVVGLVVDGGRCDARGARVRTHSVCSPTKHVYNFKFQSPRTAPHTVRPLLLFGQEDRAQVRTVDRLQRGGEDHKQDLARAVRLLQAFRRASHRRGTGPEEGSRTTFVFVIALGEGLTQRLVMVEGRHGKG